MNKIYLLSYEIESEKSEWLKLWCTSDRIPFSHPDFNHLFIKKGELIRCIYFYDNDGGVLLPFILRPLASEDWYNGDPNLYDVSGTYGYCGATKWGSPNISPIEFWTQVSDLLGGLNAISGVFRLSVLSEQEIVPLENTVYVMDNIVNLKVSEDLILADYDYKVRKNISKAKSFELKFAVDLEGTRLNDFINIYYSTMDRKNANDSYYFQFDFFISLIRKLASSVAFFYVLKDEKVISTELILLSRYNAYSFLGGTLAEYYPMRPNDLLKHEIIIWLKNHEINNYILGGGYMKNDGIYSYKKSFSPSGVMPFHIASFIINKIKYTEVCEMKAKWHNDKGDVFMPSNNYFPKYRDPGSK